MRTSRPPRGFRALAPALLGWALCSESPALASGSSTQIFDLMGYPREPYGVSNGARAHLLLPPRFDAAKIEYRGGELTVQLQLE